MANTIMPTVFASGVRRLRTLSGWPMLGSAVDPSTIADLVANGGYDMGTINTLAALGATNEQLLALPYPASSAEMAAAVANLMNQLGGAQAAPGAPAASAPSYPQSAQPTKISTGWGDLDLLEKSSWDFLNSQFVAAQQQLNALAAQNPKDPEIISMVQQFNSNVAQWANYYAQAVGGAPSPIPMASIPGLSGLGIAPLIIVGIVAGVAALAAWLWGFINNSIANKMQQRAAVLTAQNQAALLAKADAADKAGNPALGNQYRLQATGLTSPGAVTPTAPINWGLWLQQNMPVMLFGLAAVVILPSVLRRR